MHDPQVFGWEVRELDEECLVNDPDDPQVLELIEEFERLAASRLDEAA